MATLDAVTAAAGAAISVLSLRSTLQHQFPHYRISLPYSKSSSFTPLLSPNLNSNRRRLRIKLLCAAQDVAVVAPEDEVKVEEEAAPEGSGEVAEVNVKRKLYMVNLPWTMTVVDIKSLVGDCGTVVDVEIIKMKNGKSKGLVFVTMESGDEAQAVIDKFDSTEVGGRIIKVQFAKAFKKKTPRPAGVPLPGETRHKLYVSNLAWKARSTHLRDLFAGKLTPVSTKVVFENSTNRSAGYGFVSFATREEAETALATFDGQELMGRPLRLRFSERTDDASKAEKDTENEPETQEPSQES